MSLLRTAVRASVATRVIGNTHRRQQQRWAAQDAANEPAAPSAADPSILDQLAKLGELRDAGVLTDAEFEAQKLRLLSA